MSTAMELPDEGAMHEEASHSPDNSQSSNYESTPTTPVSLPEEGEEVMAKNFDAINCSESRFRAIFESYVETNFGRGTRSQTITRDSYEMYKTALATDSESSRRRVKLHEQGYRLGTVNAPEVVVSEVAPHELVLWRLKSEGRGNNYMSTKTRPRIVAPVEDFYDIITSMHHASPSASGQKKAFKMISKRYVGIPREVVIFYMRNCPHCAAVTRRRAAVPVDCSIPAKRPRPAEEPVSVKEEVCASHVPQGLGNGVEERINALVASDVSVQGEQEGWAHKAFTTYLQLLADKNLNRFLPVHEQPKEKVRAIVAAAARQFPELGNVAEASLQHYLTQCRRQRRKPNQATYPIQLSADAKRRLLEACRGERAAIIKATADSNESSIIDAITESEVAAVLTVDPPAKPQISRPSEAGPPQPSAGPQVSADDFGNLSSFFPTVSAMDLNAAATSNLLQASGLGSLSADMNPSVALAALSSLPIQPTHLAGALRMVGVLLLMVANQMDSNNGTGSGATENMASAHLNGSGGTNANDLTSVSMDQVRVNNVQ